MDGIVAEDPVSIQFRLPDGSEVARTPPVSDAIVRPATSGVEIYQFRTHWLPVASRVDLFDGYQLTEITSDRRATSSIVHFAEHWTGYLIVGGIAVILAALHFGLCAMPEHGWYAAVRRAGLVFVAVAGFLLAYVILMFLPLSPLVLGGGGAMVWALVRGSLVK